MDWDGERWSQPVQVIGGDPDGEIARQPSMIADAMGVLHLAWSGGDQGRIFYSQARIGEAAASGGWAPPQPLPAPVPVGSWPQVALDPAGRLIVVYTVPLNERRGVYLVRSEDGGETWDGPALVFDAEAAGWAAVGRATLAVAPDGGLHVAWGRGGLLGTWVLQGIYYTRSSDGGQSWLEPWNVAEAGYDWPRLALTGGRVHVLYAEVDGGSVYYCTSDVGQMGFGTPLHVPDWEGAPGPFGLAVSGPTLHLAGVDAAGRTLLYTTWDGERWSAVETFSLGAQMEGGLGSVATTLPEGGQLAVAALVSSAGDGAAVLYTGRPIPVVDVPPPASLPTAVLTSTPDPTPTITPTPLPDLTDIEVPLAEGDSDLPLYLGGGLAVAIVVGVLVVWGVRRRGQ